MESWKILINYFFNIDIETFSFKSKKSVRNNNLVKWNQMSGCGNEFAQMGVAETSMRK
jgi:hypothetical protein